MRLPVLRGIIERRILANYHIDPDVMARFLPEPFRPKLANGFAIGGICLIRLREMRPRFVRLPFGIKSENAAHRIAVEWNRGRSRPSGVFIPRRDTDSWWNVLAGGTVFPGVQHHALFKVAESDNRFRVSLRSDDGFSNLHVCGRVGRRLPSSSVFSSVEEASRFFESGALGYSATPTPGRFDGMELRCKTWQVEPLEIDRVESSFFDDESIFPPGSAEFDSALLMTEIDHQWHRVVDLCCGGTAAA